VSGLGYTENRGAFLGLGDHWPENTRFLIFTLFAGTMLFGFFVYSIFARINKPSIFGISLILGGGVSNLHDRLFNEGAVVDFLNVGFGGLRTGIFNVADMALMLGVGMFIYYQNTSSDESDEIR